MPGKRMHFDCWASSNYPDVSKRHLKNMAYSIGIENGVIIMNWFGTMSKVHKYCVVLPQI